MSVIKSLVGTLAVIFSIQPLAAWAAKGEAKGSDSKKVSVSLHTKGDVQKQHKEGGPLCGNGG